MELRKTKNGKTCFDIRKQYQKVSFMLIVRQSKETKRLIESGEITTKEQYKAHRAQQDEQYSRLYDYAYELANSVSAGHFSLHTQYWAG